MPRRKRKPDSPVERPLLAELEERERLRFAWLVSAFDLVGANLKVQALCRLVFNMTREGPPHFEETLAQIGERLGGANRSTVRRWIREAERLGLLLVGERRQCRGGQRPHQLSIDAESVRRLAVDRGTKTRHRGTKTPHRGTNLVPPIRNTSRLSVVCQSSPTAPQPPTPTAADRRSDNCEENPGDAWAVVVAELSEWLNQAAKAASAAKDRGATPDDVRSLVRWWLPRRDGWDHAEVVLYRRVGRASPGGDPSKGWPAYRGGYRSPESVQQVEFRLIRTAKRTADGRAERERNQAAYREDRAAWASLSEEERVRILDEHQPDWRVFRMPSSAPLFATCLQTEETTT